jgi:hypothetical protein
MTLGTPGAQVENLITANRDRREAFAQPDRQVSALAHRPPT